MRLRNWLGRAGVEIKNPNCWRHNVEQKANFVVLDVPNKILSAIGNLVVTHDVHVNKMHTIVKIVNKEPTPLEKEEARISFSAYPEKNRLVFVGLKEATRESRARIAGR